MKKSIFILLMVIFTVTSSFAAFVEIGNGTSSNSLCPTNGYFPYGWSSFVLTSDQIGQALELDGIKFNVANEPESFEMANQKLYVKAVSLSTITTAYPDPENNGFQLVYDGSIMWDGAGWQGVDFAQVFSYNGTSNLQFVWENRNGAAYDEGYPEFRYTSSNALIGAERSTSFSVFIPGNEMYSHPNVRLKYSLTDEPEVATLVSPQNGSEFISTSSALFWEIGENTTGVDVYLSDSYSAVNNNNATARVVENGMEETYTFSLTGGTMYYWKVVSNNSNSGLATESAIWSFATEVGQVQLPITYNFNDVVEDQVPYGWDMIHETDASWTTVGADSTHGLNDTNCLRLYNSSDPDGIFMAIAPEVNGTGAQVRFKGMTTVGHATDLKIGTISDITNAETFELIETVEITSDWTELTVPLNHETARIAFLHGLSDIYTAIYLEDVTFELGEGLELPYVQDLSPIVIGTEVVLSWTDPSNDTYTASGYKVYRDGQFLEEVTTLSYTDSNVPYGDHEYYVTAMFGEDESRQSNLVEVTIELTTGQEIIVDSFEDYEDFSLDFGDWTLVDNDLSITYGFGTSATFTNMNAQMAYIVFNPLNVVPAIEEDETFLPHTGDKYLASFASETPTNDDWLITPTFSIGTSGLVDFWAKSQTGQYGLERFNVLVSNGSTDIADFTVISGDTYVEAPLEWTNFVYDLSAYANETIRLAIQCVSDDAFIFMIDDFTVLGQDGTDIEDNNSELVTTSLKGNYPNPFNPETTISYDVKKAGKLSLDIYNIKGQKVKTLINGNKGVGNHSVVWNGRNDKNENVASGVYFYKLTSGDYSEAKKMILMK